MVRGQLLHEAPGASTGASWLTDPLARGMHVLWKGGLAQYPPCLPSFPPGGWDVGSCFLSEVLSKFSKAAVHLKGLLGARHLLSLPG